MELLTKSARCGYSWGTVVNPTVSVDLLKPKGAQAPIERFFCVRFTVDCAGELSSSPFPFGGKVNPAQFATIRLTSFAGDHTPTKGAPAMDGHAISTPNLDRIQRSLDQAKSIVLTLSVTDPEQLPNALLPGIFSLLGDLIETIQGSMEATNGTN